MANTIDFNVSSNAVTVLNQTAVAANNTAKGFTSAKAELRALQNQMLEMDQTSAEFKKASARAAELKDNISDLSAEINANAGNAFEGLSNNVGLFSSRLMDMDLKGAGQALSGMGAAVRRIDFKTVKDEVGGLVKGLGNLALSVVSNPFFLIAGVLAAIAYNYKDIAKWANQSSLAQQNLAKVTDDLNKATEQELVKGGQKIAQIEILTDRVKDNNLTEQERRQALEDLETMYPAYFSNLNGDINDTEALNAAKEKLISSIKAEAKANAAKSLLEAEYAKKISLETELNSKRGKLSQEEFNKAVEDAKFNQQTLFKETNQNITDWWSGTEGIGAAAVNLEESIQRIAFLENEATAAVLANVQTEVKAIRQKTQAASSSAKTQTTNKVNELEKELEANAIKAAEELKQEKELEAAKLKVREDYIKANQSAQANELYELEKKRELELQKWEGDEEDKVFITEKYRLAEIEINNKYDELALEQQNAFNEKKKAEEEKLSQAVIDSQKKVEQHQREITAKRLQMASDAFGALSALTMAFDAKSETSARNQFKINKAFSLSQAIINTYQAVNAALTAGGNPAKLATGAQFVEAGIALTAGLANVIKIQQTKFDSSTSSGGGGGVNAPSGGGGTTAPSPANFAFLGMQPNQQQPPLQAYVVSTQVSSNLEAQQLIQNQSRLGG
jgi:hypothetical protein